jgi:hypothetical protein
MTHWALGCLLAALAVSIASAQTAVTDRHGAIKALRIDGEYLAVQTDVRVPLKGWGRIPHLGDARDVRFSDEGGKRTWTGRIEVEPGKNYRFTQALEEADGTVFLWLEVTAEAEVEIEGVFFWLDVPIESFSGGSCELRSGDRAATSAEFPREQPENRHFLRASADGLNMASAGDRTRLGLSFDRAIPVTVQDTREWRGTVYSAFCQLAPSLAAGETTSLVVQMRPEGEPDESPAHLALHPDAVRYRLHGFGGNYCFGIESPVTQYTLKNLRIAWARTEMTPYEWEPENDNDDPGDANWEYLKSQDKPDSNLRREFLLARQIQDMGVPYVISIWALPRWLYAEPADSVRGGRRKIHPDKWDELLECLGSYLLYAKEQYGVEPDLFSFNEANIGVDVLLTAEEHREAIKTIGAHFEKLGLKTKMLLADATGPRGTHTYAEPAAADPEAMKYVTAVGFHSWGGASPEQYAAWAALAERLRLPLLVTELGVDAGAWRGRAYDSFHYAIREVQHYQEVLLHARPQGTMQWEFTSDYGTVKVEKNEAGEEELVPTVRFHFVKHFCNLTPQHSDALITESDNPKVLLTAFSKDGEGLTLHIANIGSARPATIEGIPDQITRMRAVRTSETEGFQELEAVHVENGTVELELGPLSLLTLTTVGGEDQG